MGQEGEIAPEQSSFLAGMHNKFSAPFDSLPRDCPFTSVIIKQLWQSARKRGRRSRLQSGDLLFKLTGQGAADIQGTYSNLSCHVRINHHQTRVLSLPRGRKEINIQIDETMKKYKYLCECGASLQSINQSPPLPQLSSADYPILRGITHICHIRWIPSELLSSHFGRDQDWLSIVIISRISKGPYRISQELSKWLD